MRERSGGTGTRSLLDARQLTPMYCNKHAIYSLQAYETDSTEPSEQAVGRVSNLMAAFPNRVAREGGEEEVPVPELTALVGAAVKWLRK